MQANNRKALIVGCNGQLGSDMVTTFRAAGYSTTGVDFPEIDITNRDATCKLIKETRPDFIINCAAFAAVDDCETHQEKAFAVNADGPGNLAIGASQSNSQLVHISTDYVFDGTKKEPYIETDQTGPTSIYGKSKLKGEQLIEQNCSRFQIFRIAWLYGRNGHNFVKAIRNGALKKKAAGEPLIVVADQQGTPTSTIEVCKQILHCIDKDLYGTIHCTCEGLCTWYDFATEIVRGAGIDIQVLPCTTADYPRPAPRPANSVLENSRLKSNGLQIMSDWKRAFNAFLAHETE